MDIGKIEVKTSKNRCLSHWPPIEEKQQFYRQCNKERK